MDVQWQLPIGARVADVVAGTESNRVYVSADDRVTVMADGEVAARIPVGADAKRLILTADEALLYVVGYDGSVRVISTPDHTVTTISGIPSTAEVVSRDGRHLYAAHPAASIESTYSHISAMAADGTSLGTVAIKNYATGIDVSPDGCRLYIATSTVSSYTQFFPGWVTVIDTEQHAMVDSIPVPVSPDTVTVSLDGSRVFVTHYDTNSISAIDVAQRSVISVNLPDAPISAVIAPDGGVYVIAMQSLLAVDFAARIAEIIPAGKMPRRMQFSAHGTRACVTDLASSRVAVLDTINNSVIAAIKMDGQPEALALSGNGESLYVADYWAGTLSAISIGSVLRDAEAA